MSTKKSRYSQSAKFHEVSVVLPFTYNTFPGTQQIRPAWQNLEMVRICSLVVAVSTGLVYHFLLLISHFMVRILKQGFPLLLRSCEDK